MALGDGIRRNIATVTIEERHRLRDAIVALHKNSHYPGVRTDSPVGGVSFWFKQDEIHARTHVHGCPAFLPWHRELINRFEALLRVVDPALSLHYWDWTTDPGFMFTSDFMGSPQGLAGDPWASAGFYDPNANPFRSDNEFDPNNNPFDPPLDITRAVQPGAPIQPSEDAALLAASDFTTFDSMMQGLHARGHGAIGGTLNDPHKSFRDPVVFLLHSNVDRLFAMWQRQPGHPERLDPAQVYGALSNTIGSGDVASGQPNWGILSPVEPWAGPAAQTGATGIIANVAPARPWAPPENQELVKDSRDPTVVIPASYDTAPHASYFVLDRDTFSATEVQVTSIYPGALSIVYDGFTPQELGLPAGAPTVTLTFDLPTGAPATGMVFVAESPQYEDPARAPDLPQRIVFALDLSFTDASAFATFPEQRTVNVRVTFGGATNDASIELVNQPNPYMLDGPVTWLSTDVRVFQMRPGQTLAGVAQGDPAANPAAPLQFVTSTLQAFNSSPNDGSHPFLGISTDQQTSQLELSRTVAGISVLNYAVAKVRYRASTVNAGNVQVFFRLFSTVVSALDYNTFTNYRRAVNAGVGTPLLGLIDGEIASMPFFSSARIDSSTQDMSQQADPGNVQTLNATGQESVAYFGCWLDFNQADPQFPLSPTGDGNFGSNRLPISQLIRNTHQCIVAEIFFEPAGVDPILTGATPASSDRLSQRNLLIVESDNPGGAPSHTVQTTFVMRPDQSSEDPTVFDELYIAWNNLPRDSKASLYVPEWNAADVIGLANLRQHPGGLSKIDDHTVALPIADVTFVPIPAGATASYAAFLSLELPQTVMAGQSFVVDLRQYSRGAGRFRTAFRWTIPVSTADGMLPREVRKWASLQFIASAIPTTNRWSPVFVRYLGQVSARLTDIGGDPAKIPPSLDDPAVSLINLCLFATGNLQIADRVQLKKSDGSSAPIGNAGTVETNIGAGATVGAVSSRAPVVLRSGARVNGALTTGQTVTRQNGTVVTGPIVEHSFIALPHLALAVAFPPSHAGAVVVGPGQTRTLTPGAYGALTVQSRATLSLSTGTYYFDSLDVEPQATLSCSSKAGQIVIYVKDNVIFRGTIAEHTAPTPRLFLGVVGTSSVAIEAPFKGTLVAPNAPINLATVGAPGHTGAFFGKDITVQPDNTVSWVPFGGLPILSP